MMRRRTLLIALLILCCAPLRAQWSGSVDLSAGIGGMEGTEVSENKPMIHAITEGTFLLNYNTQKFTWKTKLTGKWEPKTTDNARLSYKTERLAGVYKSATTKPLTISARSDFRWKPSAVRYFDTWILYQYKNDRAQNHSISADGNLEEMQKFSYYYEIPVMDEHKVQTGLKTFRSFNSSRTILQSSLSLETIASQKNNTWVVFKTDPGKGGSGAAVSIEDVQGYAWKYRITPNSFDFNLDGDIHVQMTPLDQEVKLKYAPGVRLVTKLAIDHNSGATRINPDPDATEEIWKDSLRLRESFNYLSLQAEPYITADLTWRSLEAHADYACQVYARRLNDDIHQQPLKVKGLYPVGKANLRWTISPNHSLNLTNEMSVKHPDYLKVCWYDRTAGYLDQLYRGNEQLYSPWTQKYGLEYRFKWKRFSAQSTISYTNVMDEIDQTWSNEEIDGRQYKIFRWLNSADSHALGLKQTLGWDGKIISAHAGITYNQTWRIAKTDGAIKKSFDWRLTGDISARLGKGWSIGVDTRYRSKVATFFTIFKEYCELNAHVQKDFKRFTLFFDAKDLLDQPRETSFESDELKEYWIEEVRSNRRLFILGARWKF